MDKSLVLAVAGSGKTSHLVKQLDANKRTLLLTYTDNNFDNLRRKVCSRFGCVPEHVVIDTYFSFLNGFCYRPYLVMEMKSRGISFESPPLLSSMQPLDSDKRYLDGARRVYNGRMAKLIDVKNCIPDLLARLNRYYEAVYIDEAQDFGGHDFNFLTALCQANVSFLMVGDFFQHTYSTSADGNVNKGLYGDLQKYTKILKKAGIAVNDRLLEKSHRCSSEVCGFISQYLGVAIESAAKHSSNVILVEDAKEIERLHACRKTVKLFFEEHALYNCYSDNWGASKGIDHYHDVLVILNKTSWKAYKKGSCKELKPLSRNKLYVACSRARGNLYFASSESFKRFMQ